MKYLLPALAATAAFAVPTLAEAKQVTFETKLTNFGGNPAYVAIYLTDASGKYKGTVWMAGTKTRYYRHLYDWERASGGSLSQVDGITGASVGSGRTLSISADISDALLNAGYQIHVDTASEGGMDNPSEVVMPLSADSVGKVASGSGYVKSFKVSF